MNQFDIEFSINDERWIGFESIIEKAIRLALGTWQQDISGRPCELSVVLCDDDEIQELNRDYREKDKPTNVLSFPAMEAEEEGLLFLEPGPLHLGDIIISYDRLLEEAKDQEITFEDHLSHLAIHGTLHLLGYDHIDDDEAETMESLEITLLTQLGIANPYLFEAE